VEKYLIVITLAFSSTVYAQQSNLPTQCINGSSLDEVLDEYDEIPFVRGMSFREGKSKQVENSVVFFVNAKTKTWTLVEKFGDNKYCVLAAGGDFEPVPMKVIDDIINERQKSKS
jgi:hypothetical protein